MNRHTFSILTLLLFCSFSFSHQAIEKRALTVTDIMKFKEIKDVQISDDGNWIAYSAVPDRGAITGYVKSVSSDISYEIAEGVKPVLSKDSHWVIFTRAISLLENEKSSEKEKKKLKPGLVLLNAQTGKQSTFKRVKSAAFSGDSQYVGILFEKESDKEEDSEIKKKDNEKLKESDDKKKREHFLDKKTDRKSIPTH